MSIRSLFLGERLQAQLTSAGSDVCGLGGRKAFQGQLTRRGRTPTLGARSPVTSVRPYRCSFGYIWDSGMLEPCGREQKLCSLQHKLAKQCLPKAVGEPGSICVERSGCTNSTIPSMARHLTPSSTSCSSLLKPCAGFDILTTSSCSPSFHPYHVARR